MIKTVIKLEIKIGERTYQLECDPNSPLGEIHDAICMMKHEIIDRIVKQQEAEKNNEQP